MIALDTRSFRAQLTRYHLAAPFATGHALSLEEAMDEALRTDAADAPA